jgi:hypothetical protein
MKTMLTATRMSTVALGASDPRSLSHGLAKALLAVSVTIAACRSFYVGPSFAYRYSGMLGLVAQHDLFIELSYFTTQ